MDETNQLAWTDYEGRRWSTRFEIPDARALRDRYDIGDDKLINKVLADPVELLDFAVEFFRPQWSKHTDVLDEIAFMVALTKTKTSLIEAHDAIVAGLTDFFLRCGDVKRAAVLERTVAAIKTANELVIAKIHSAEVDQAFDRELAKATKKFDDVLATSFGGESSNYSEKSDSVRSYE